MKKWALYFCLITLSKLCFCSDIVSVNSGVGDNIIQQGINSCGDLLGVVGFIAKLFIDEPQIDYKERRQKKKHIQGWESQKLIADGKAKTVFSSNEVTFTESDSTIFPGLVNYKKLGNQELRIYLIDVIKNPSWSKNKYTTHWVSVHEHKLRDSPLRTRRIEFHITDDLPNFLYEATGANHESEVFKRSMKLVLGERWFFDRVKPNYDFYFDKLTRRKVRRADPLNTNHSSNPHNDQRISPEFVNKIRMQSQRRYQQTTFLEIVLDNPSSNLSYATRPTRLMTLRLINLPFDKRLSYDLKNLTDSERNLTLPVLESLGTDFTQIANGGSVPDIYRLVEFSGFAKEEDSDLFPITLTHKAQMALWLEVLRDFFPEDRSNSLYSSPNQLALAYSDFVNKRIYARFGFVPLDQFARSTKDYRTIKDESPPFTKNILGTLNAFQGMSSLDFAKTLELIWSGSLGLEFKNYLENLFFEMHLSPKAMPLSMALSLAGSHNDSKRIIAYDALEVFFNGIINATRERDLYSSFRTRESSFSYYADLIETFNKNKFEIEKRLSELTSNPDFLVQKSALNFLETLKRMDFFDSKFELSIPELSKPSWWQ